MKRSEGLGVVHESNGFDVVHDVTGKGRRFVLVVCNRSEEKD